MIGNLKAEPAARNATSTSCQIKVIRSDSNFLPTFSRYIAVI